MAKRNFNIDESGREKIKKTQEAAIKITKKHLAAPVREIESLQYEAQEVACALIMLGYHILRQSKPQTVAEEAFEILAHFGMQRLEEGRKKVTRARLN